MDTKGRQRRKFNNRGLERIVLKNWERRNVTELNGGLEEYFSGEENWAIASMTASVDRDYRGFVERSTWYMENPLFHWNSFGKDTSGLWNLGRKNIRVTKCRHGWWEKERKDDDYIGKRMQGPKGFSFSFFFKFLCKKENTQISVVKRKETNGERAWS